MKVKISSNWKQSDRALTYHSPKSAHPVICASRELHVEAIDGQELFVTQCHRARLAAAGVVLPSERHVVIRDVQ